MSGGTWGRTGDGRTVRGGRVLAVVALAAMVLAGCSDDADPSAASGDAGTAGAATGSAAEASAASGAAPDGMTPDEAVAAAVERVDGAGTAVVALEVQQRSGGSARTVLGKGRIDAAGPAVEIEYGVRDAEGERAVQEIEVDGVVHRREGGSGGWRRGGRGAAVAGGPDAGGYPLDQLALLDLLTGVRTGGRGDVNGVATTWFSGTVRMKDAQAAEGTRGTPSSGLVAAYAAAKVREIPVELHLDPKGLPARIVTQLPEGTSDAEQLMVRTDFGGWGSGGGITPPKGD